MVEIPRTPEDVVESTLFDSSQPLSVVQIEEVTGIGEDELKPILLKLKDNNCALMNSRFRWRLTNERRMQLLSRCNLSPEEVEAMNNEARSMPLPPLRTAEDRNNLKTVSVFDKMQALRQEAEERMNQIPVAIASVRERANQEIRALEQEHQKLTQVVLQLGGNLPQVSETALSDRAKQVLAAVREMGETTPAAIAIRVYNTPNNSAAASQCLRGLVAKGLIRAGAKRGRYEAVR